jgi:hypothetical protein
MSEPGRHGSISILPPSFANKGKPLPFQKSFDQATRSPEPAAKTRVASESASHRKDTKTAMDRKELDKSEFGNLIGSDKVEGTAVFGVNDRKIGTIERVMIDKISGKVSYAVLGFGGFLGVGNDHYPLPWQSLKYDTDLGGYRTGVTESQLRGAPKYGDEGEWNWSDLSRTRAVNDYYGVPVP